jgi:hypothetical protein
LVIGLAASPPAAGPSTDDDLAQAESTEDALETRLGGAKAACVPAADSQFVEILDDGAGMSIDGVGANKPRGADLDQIECILTELSAPSTVRVRMGNTRALDGTQDAAWSSLRATWTYHPDSGVSIVIEEEGSP